MFIGGREIENEATLAADLCLIGGGAAGNTLARALIGSGRWVMLLESGGFEFDGRTQSLYERTNPRFHSSGSMFSRLRCFGGTTNRWAGHCPPLDPIDFEPRPWMAHSGWPISRADLTPTTGGRRQSSSCRPSTMTISRSRSSKPARRPCPSPIGA